MEDSGVLKEKLPLSAREEQPTMKPSSARALLSVPKTLALRTKGVYQRPAHDLEPGSTGSSPKSPRFFRVPPSRLAGRRKRVYVVAFLVWAFLAALAGCHRRRSRLRQEEIEREREPVHWPWENYQGLGGFYNGIRTLIPSSQWVPEQVNLANQADPNITVHPSPPMQPEIADPYPDYESAAYLKKHHPVKACFLDDDDKVPAPDIYSYPGIPANMPAPHWGSYDSIGVSADKCWERFGRLGPYGYSYSRDEGGLGLSGKSERSGAEEVLDLFEPVDYRKVSWGRAQKKCFEKNKRRFEQDSTSSWVGSSRKRVQRNALVLRTYTGYEYTDIQLLSLRAMINELSLKSGGEYDVHLLVHVKDNALPIWASPDLYQQVLRDNVPREFWEIATLWTEDQMRVYYPGPFPSEENFENHAGNDHPIYGVYRSAHFALQWFSQEHPEYDFVWNWEMDLRNVGHHYEFHQGVAKWADAQPRKLLWERSARWWTPDLHGSYEDFMRMVERDTLASGEKPIWGPLEFPTNGRGMMAHPNGTEPPTSFARDNYEWGVGEPADLITFNPLFDPAKTTWGFRLDVTGYNTTLEPPPRRCSIVTATRLSRRLLSVMHEETWNMHHVMFPEMFAASVALHHGLKAVYAPHPIHFDRVWPLEFLDRWFNRPQTPEESPFGGHEFAHQGSSFYYNSGFSGALWRRWLGWPEGGGGGNAFEEPGWGRMCLRGLLHHPVKFEGVE